MTSISNGQNGNDLTKTLVIGYQDNNKDGINDLFIDANGDGKNDINSLNYPHSFKFEDKNKDDINDLWIDKDGDGVNDLMMKQLKKMGVKPQIPWVDKDGDGIQDRNVKPQYKTDLRQFVLDLDKNNKNDITDLELTDTNIMGYRYGRIDEEKDKELKKIDDKNSDGMHDKFDNRFKNDMNAFNQCRKYDYFIDKDGDGISDSRGLKKFGRNRGMGNKYGKKQKR